tara:strand:- start:7093 stop:7269 length:177 start_codon:yes stop_codon:yes gene_type:complete
MKPLNPSKVYAAHTSKTKKPMGDYYGTGIKQKVGKSRSDSMANPVPKSKLGVAPKKLA